MAVYVKSVGLCYFSQVYAVNDQKLIILLKLSIIFSIPIQTSLCEGSGIFTIR